MRVNLTFDIDERTINMIRRSSIERVINNTIRVFQDNDDGEVDIILEDWIEWKPVIVSMWVALHQAILNKMFATDVVLRKGEL